MAKTMIVTSATSGIGKAIAKKLLKESTDKNDKLIINYFDKRLLSFMPICQHMKVWKVLLMMY